MSEPILSLAAKFTLPSKAKAEGTFTLTSTQLIWEPDELGAADSVLVAIKDVSGLQRAKGKPLLRLTSPSGPVILEFAVEHERDAVVDHMNLLTSEHKQPVASSGQPGQLSGPDAAAKQKLLDSDSGLAQLWRQLVQGGVLSDGEFWATRQNLLGRSAAPPPQRQGFASTMIASVVPSADGKTKQVKMQLTPQIIQQLWREEPHMQAAFKEHVPRKMDQASFWRKYGEFLVQKASAKTKARLKDLEEEYSMFRQPVAAMAAPNMYRSLDPGLNLAADYYDSFSEGYGNLHDARKQRASNDAEKLRMQESATAMESSGQANDIMAAINRHGIAVLAGPEARTATGRSEDLKEPGEQQRRMDSALDDLRAQRGDLHAPLQVQSHRDLVSTSGPSHSFRGDPQGAAADHSWEAALEAAQQAVAGLGQGDSTGSCMDPGHAAAALHSHMASVHSNAAGALPGPLEQRVRQQALTVNELLRHFWAAMPLELPGRQQKAQRMADELQARNQAIAQLLREQPQHASSLRSMAAPLQDAIRAAEVRFEHAKLSLAQAKQAKIMGH